MPETGTRAVLYLNGKAVGTVVVRGANTSWSYGDFQPAEAFAEFAPLFGQWSLLMHADDDDEKLSPAASEELRSAEYQIDRLQARLYFPDRECWRGAAQLNIDGSLIEWKEV